jgi:hypothetical protein
MTFPSKAWTSLESYFPRAEGRLRAGCYRPGFMLLDRRTKKGQIVASFAVGRTDVIEWTKQPEGLYWVRLFWPQLWGTLDAPLCEGWGRWGPDRHWVFERYLTRGLMKSYLPWLRETYITMAHRKLEKG